ncbi:hypothetical protein, partial [Pseudomonas syringae group genomosp. 7]|uniref:hypothetical protein n=1 Tax=Pseudomonas syringae group genomosp. 7 TaxID=251699 RepID=UPI00376F6507
MGLVCVVVGGVFVFGDGGVRYFCGVVWWFFGFGFCGCGWVGFVVGFCCLLCWGCGGFGAVLVFVVVVSGGGAENCGEVWGVVVGRVGDVRIGVGGGAVIGIA